MRKKFFDYVEELNHILASHSGQSIETIKEDTERDNFMTAKAALEYGLVDKILSRNELINSDK